MRYLLFTLFGIINLARAQTPSEIIAQIKSINSTVSKMPGDGGFGNIISNRGLNLFLAGKIGSYLSEGNDLSFYKNNLTLNSGDGVLTLNHNLFQAKGMDEQVRGFMVVGVKANIANGFAAAFNGRRYLNDFGFTIRQTWLGKAITYFDKCGLQHEDGYNHPTCQKLTMDAIRAGILHRLEIEINKKTTEFELALNVIDSLNDIPGQSLHTAQEKARKNFNADIKEEYLHKYADMQAQALLKTNNYSKITSSWTSISGYFPLILERFTVANSLSSTFNLKRAYLLSLTLSHTRFWESTKFGRLFITGSGTLYWNNSKQSQSLQYVSYDTYKILGGTDTINVAKLNSSDLYIGSFNTFITPVITGKVVYIPPNWHFGITLIVEKNIGRYEALNGTLGIPIVLIDKYANPSLNFEFQVKYFDLTNVVIPAKKIGAKTSIGLTVGIPFSKIIY